MKKANNSIEYKKLIADKSIEDYSLRYAPNHLENGLNCLL